MITRRQILANASQLCLLGALVPTYSQTQSAFMQRAIPKTGERLPVIGLGTYRTFNVADNAAELDPLRQVLELFFRHGGTVVPTPHRPMAHLKMLSDTYLDRSISLITYSLQLRYAQMEKVRASTKWMPHHKKWVLKKLI
ncbi:MAG: hypothetical protein ACJ0S4_06520 [Candidatus Rariloculaceae bacterium]